jgi:hypothetical protein
MVAYEIPCGIFYPVKKDMFVILQEQLIASSEGNG